VQRAAERPVFTDTACVDILSSGSGAALEAIMIATTAPDRGEVGSR
jgi:hypothetical protein